MIKRILWTAFVVATLIAATSAGFAPYLYVESWPWLHPPSAVKAEPAKVAKGQMFDDYFVVENLGPGTYAIGEPRYYQANYSYLIIGDKRALMFDAGSGTRDIRPVVSALTQLPVTVLPSHFHYDHWGGVASFDRVAMIDLDETRSSIVDGRFTPSRYDFLGMFEGIRPSSVKVTEWLKPGASIDLGGRSLTVLLTPGHTSQSVALLDRREQRLFSGDFIYPTMLYAFLPGASLSAYRKTVHELVATLPADTILWAAHCCRRDEGFLAPWLSMDDLKDLGRALAQMEDGQLKHEGFFPRRYPVNHQMIMGTGFPWNNR